LFADGPSASNVRGFHDRSRTVIRALRASLGGAVAAALLIPALTSVASAQPAPGVPVVGGAAAPPAAPAAPAGAATAIAGVTPVLVDKPSFDPPKDGRVQGWAARVSTSATVSFANNSNVVGQADGSSYAFGLKFDGTLDYNRDKHEWRNTLGALGSVTHTPIINELVKSSDNLALDSTYLYHVVPWFGPFARLSANTSMFRGTDVRAVASHYKITLLDGTVQTKTANELPLSDPFKPFTFKQSVGVFVQPYASDPFTIELRAGAGGQEVWANDQFSVTPTAAAVPGKPFDPFEVDVKQLQDVDQLGAELALSLWGSFMNKKVTYKANADAMTPFAHSALPAGDTRGAFALTNVQIDAALSFHLVDWASIDYQLKAIRQPQVIDNFQVQNTLLLTFGMTYTNKTAPPPAAPVPPPAPPPPPAPAPPAH
jgi:hypothetical protein